MNNKIIFLSFGLFFIVSNGFAQKKEEHRSIISENVAIKKYHNKEELEQMQKGELLVLYIERIESLIKTLPYIAFSTKPGVTMSSAGIPNNKSNRKVLDRQFETTNDYLEKTIEFQKKLLPYSDTNKIIDAILFYEEMMKLLHEYNEFH